MKYIQALLLPLALAAFQMNTAAAQSEPPPSEAQAEAETDLPLTVEELQRQQLEALEDEATSEIAETVVSEDAAVTPVERSFLAYTKSPLLSSLIGDTIVNDDVAKMGVVSGARRYCDIDWQQGFVTFIQLASEQNLILERVADDHGYYMGVANLSLKNAEYECSEQDFVDLRAINPY
ncbi:hypothetical protein [Ponticaulis profundi]|uniref:Uncharacterized protein n=1 Tax=Ponticaulis profundi TaxID=2665222 RepID=A0ABW1SAS4_9PROT